MIRLTLTKYPFEMDTDPVTTFILVNERTWLTVKVLVYLCRQIRHFVRPGIEPNRSVGSPGLYMQSDNDVTYTHVLYNDNA